jgi:hypothetical protein
MNTDALLEMLSFIFDPYLFYILHRLLKRTMVIVSNTVASFWQKELVEHYFGSKENRIERT